MLCYYTYSYRNFPTRTKRGEVYMCVLIVNGQPICITWNFDDSSNVLGARKSQEEINPSFGSYKMMHWGYHEGKERTPRHRQPCFKGRERKWRHMKMCTAKYETVTK